jgi:hypothetical protein
LFGSVVSFFGGNGNSMGLSDIVYRFQLTENNGKRYSPQRENEGRATRLYRKKIFDMELILFSQFK